MSFSKERHPKVFISYSHDSPEHKDRVLYLSDRLRGDGIDCHIDQYEVSPHEGWPRWMINQIEEADFVLIVCTEQYDRRFRGKAKVGEGLGGKWEGAIITQELYDAEGNNIKFIPVVFFSDEEVFIPIMLRGATHYEMNTGEGYEGLYRHLSNQPKIQKPDLGKLRPVPPLSRKQDFSKLFTVPYPRNHFFTGREEVLEEMHGNLFSQGLAALIQPIAITGLGGIGKTQIAIEYAYRFREKYSAVLWVRGSTHEEIFSDFQTIAELLDLPIAQAEDQNILIAAVKRWLEEKSGWLLIFDNADDPTLIEDFIPLQRPGHILLTSRAQVLGILGASMPLRVNKLLPDEAEKFFIKRTGRKGLNPKEIEALRKIAKELDYLPLALEQAGAYIIRMECSFEDYLLSYTQRGLELLEKYKPVFGKYPKSVVTTWSLNFEFIEQKSPASSDLMRVSAFLSPDEIPLELFISGAEELGVNIATALEKVSENPLCLDEIIEPLSQYSLIRKNLASRSYDIHRLVQAVLKDGMDYDIRRLWAERTIRALYKTFPDDPTDKELWERLLPHVISCRELIKLYLFDIVEAITILNNTGSYLLGAGRYSEAEQLFKHASEIFEKLYGSECPQLAGYLSNLGWAISRQDRFAEAELLLKRALNICEETSDPVYPVILNNLAEVLREKGEFPEAESYYKQAIAILEKLSGGEDLNLAGSLNNLSELHRQKEDNVSARPLTERALSIKEKFLGLDHPGLIPVLINLAKAFGIEGNDSQAETLLMRAQSICEKTFGPDHPSFSLILNHLALIYQRRRNYENAESLLKRALAIDERTVGHDHTNTALKLSNLTSLYEELGLIDEAITTAEDGLEIREKLLGVEHLDIVTILTKLISLYKKKGRIGKAISLSKRIVTIQQKKIGLENPELALSLHNLGVLYEEIEDNNAAALYYKQALNMYEKIYGIDHFALKLTLLSYGGLLVSKLNKGTEGHKLLARYQAIEEQKYKLIKDYSRP